MTAGRKPKPTTLKLLHGNPGKRALSKNEPKPVPKTPTMPTTLNREAKAEWNRIVKELDQVGLLTRVDRGALAAYCMAWAHMIHAHQMIEKHGAVLIVEQKRVEDEEGTIVVICMPVKNPYMQIFKDSATLVRAFAAEFGLTPSARTRIEVPKPDDDSLDAILGTSRSRGDSSS